MDFNSFNTNILLIRNLFPIANKGVYTLNTFFFTFTKGKNVFRSFILIILDFSYLYILYSKLIKNIIAL